MKNSSVTERHKIQPVITHLPPHPTLKPSVWWVQLRPVIQSIPVPVRLDWKWGMYNGNQTLDS